MISIFVPQATYQQRLCSNDSNANHHIRVFLNHHRANQYARKEWVETVDQQKHQHLESLDTSSLTRLILNIQQQVAAQEELLQELQSLLAKGKVNQAELDSVAIEAESDSVSHCPYCQCDWVYRHN
jgi:uncharacterized Zn-finger protein